MIAHYSHSQKKKKRSKKIEKQKEVFLRTQKKYDPALTDSLKHMKVFFFFLKCKNQIKSNKQINELQLNNTIKSNKKSHYNVTHSLTHLPHPKKSNMNAEATRRHIGLAIGVFFEFIPVSTIAPGLGLAVNQAAAGSGWQDSW